jgi:type I restriction-modification system DNA methylase subunit
MAQILGIQNARTSASTTVYDPTCGSGSQEVSRYARMVPVSEIEKNDFNLNLPRYIDSQTPEDRQDIEGHLRGGIPEADVDALSNKLGCDDLTRYDR